jgi:4-hydroxybenzoyl-CoA thioesterase
MARPAQTEEVKNHKKESEGLTIVGASARHYYGFQSNCRRIYRVTSLTFSRQLTIEWAHCDPAGIVFNPRFFEFFDTNTWMLFEKALGVKPQDLAATYNIFSIPLVDARANFLKPSRFGDTVDMVSRVSAFRRSSFSVEHRIVNKGETAVKGEEVRVWAARDTTDPDKITSATIPAEVIACFGNS